MKNIRWILISLLALAFFACNPSSDSSVDPASYVQFASHQWEKGSFDCNKFKDKCAVVKLNFPQAMFGDDQVRSSINSEIQNYVSSELAKAARTNATAGKSIQDLAEAALDKFDPQNKNAYAEVSIFGQVMFRNNHFIKLELSSYLKDNAGQVNSNRTLYTFDSKEGKILTQTNLNNGAPKLAEVSMN